MTNKGCGFPCCFKMLNVCFALRLKMVQSSQCRLLRLRKTVFAKIRQRKILQWIKDAPGTFAKNITRFYVKVAIFLSAIADVAFNFHCCSRFNMSEFQGQELAKRLAIETHFESTILNLTPSVLNWREVEQTHRNFKMIRIKYRLKHRRRCTLWNDDSKTMHKMGNIFSYALLMHVRPFMLHWVL